MAAPLQAAAGGSMVRSSDTSRSGSEEDFSIEVHKHITEHKAAVQGLSDAAHLQAFVAAPAIEEGECADPKSNVANSPEDEVQRKLRILVEQNKVVLFMQGSPDMPLCGFSRAVAQFLEAERVEDYAYVDVLKYPEVREGLKKFSDCPIIPQLYVEGKFFWGCDIVPQMPRHGELKNLLDNVC